MACTGRAANPGGPNSTAQALVQTAQAAGPQTATAVAQITVPAPTHPARASAAVSKYAQQVLAISVTIVKAGGFTGDNQRLIELPDAGEAA